MPADAQADACGSDTGRSIARAPAAALLAMSVAVWQEREGGWEQWGERESAQLALAGRTEADANLRKARKPPAAFSAIPVHAYRTWIYYGAQQPLLYCDGA